MLTMEQINEAIEAMEDAVAYNVKSVLSAKNSGPNGIHRVAPQAQSLSAALLALHALKNMRSERETVVAPQAEPVVEPLAEPLPTTAHVETKNFGRQRR